MKLERMAEAALGVYLILPGLEDWAAGGTTLLPSAAIGLALVADAFKVKRWF